MRWQRRQLLSNLALLLSGRVGANSGCTAAGISGGGAAAAKADGGRSGGMQQLQRLREGDVRLYLVRHGQTEWNNEGRVQGRSDIDLNDRGLQQAVFLADALADLPIGLVASSNLKRAAVTADTVHQRHSVAPRARSGDFAEVCFGDLEGAKVANVREDMRAIYRAWSMGDGDVPFPGIGGETYNQAVARGRAGLRKLGVLPSESAAARSPRHVAVVAHGRFNLVLMSALCADEATKAQLLCATSQGNTCINVVDVSADGACSIVALNMLDHLPQAMR
eukprot:2817786-Pleurochrysis_carterae.AAC.1